MHHNSTIAYSATVEIELHIWMLGQKRHCTELSAIFLPIISVVSRMPKALS